MHVVSLVSDIHGPVAQAVYLGGSRSKEPSRESLGAGGPLRKAAGPGMRGAAQRYVRSSQHCTVATEIALSRDDKA